MTQEDKDLLLKDLCARMPYQPLCKKVDTEDDFYEYDVPLGYSLRDLIGNKIIIKPYLRPMSSMTEEEESEYHGLCYPEWNNGGLDGGNWHYHNTISSIDWLNAHHIDYRNLIEKGLALEAPEGMYKEE